MSNSLSGPASQRRGYENSRNPLYHALLSQPYNLKDTESELRWAAAAALGDIGIDAEAAIQPLVRLLRDKDQKVRESAAASLEQLRGNSTRQSVRRR